MLLNYVSAGAFLCIQTIGTALAQAQAPGAGMPQGQNPPPPATSPGQAPSLGVPSSPGATDSMPARVDDKKFAKDAAVSGLIQVELGKLATQKASKGEIKQFGEELAADHSKANEQLKRVASKENIQVPDSLDSKHQSQIDKLAKLDGEDFDKAFLKNQLRDRQAAVRDFNSEAQSGTDPELRTFASNMLPKLQQQLELAKNLAKNNKNQDKNEKSSAKQ
jgi:putative membrane protein